jgi:hypothetical protein
MQQVACKTYSSELAAARTPLINAPRSTLPALNATDALNKILG